MLDPAVLNATLDAVMRGSPDAFLTVTRAYSPALRSFLASQIFHLDDVDDVAQETLIAAYRSLQNFRRGEDFGHWLRGIARNKLLRYFEQSKRRANAMETFRREGATLIASELDAAASKTRSEHLQTMLSCIAKLPERLRHVVRSALDGDKSTSVASELESSVGAIYQLQYRALKALRECMNRETTHGN